jgi:hypothetical protein
LIAGGMDAGGEFKVMKFEVMETNDRFRHLCYLVRFAPLILVSMLAGCVTTTPMNGSVPPESFVEIPVPASSRVGLFNHKDARSYIPIYGFFKQMQTIPAESELNAKLRELGFDAGKELQQILVSKLTLRDIQARSLSAERPDKIILPKLDLATLPLQEDSWAVLDARITGVALDADMSGTFRPLVALLVQLIEVRTNRVLYDNRFIYNGRAAKATRIPYDPRAQWTDIEAIKNDLPGVCEAIVAALDKMADLIAIDLSSKQAPAQ